jgi:hypothetical protein
MVELLLDESVVRPLALSSPDAGGAGVVRIKSVRCAPTPRFVLKRRGQRRQGWCTFLVQDSDALWVDRMARWGCIFAHLTLKLGTTRGKK